MGQYTAANFSATSDGAGGITDPGAAYYEERYRQRVLSNLQRRAKAFGYVLQAAAPQAVGVS